MWKRNGQDPLARLIFQKHHMHLLPLPRDGVRIGDVYPVCGGVVRPSGSIQHLIRSSIDLPKPRRGEVLPDIAGTTSSAVESHAAITFLSGFLSALGLLGMAAKVQGAMTTSRATGLCFRFAQPRRDSVDPFELQAVLEESPLDVDASLWNDDCRYYLVTATMRSNAIGVVARRGDGSSVALDVAAGSGSVDARRGGASEVVYRGDRELVFAVQVHELQRLKGASNQLTLAGADRLILVRSTAESASGLEPAVVGDPEGDIALPFAPDVADASSVQRTETTNGAQ